MYICTDRFFFGINSCFFLMKIGKLYIALDRWREICEIFKRLTADYGLKYRPNFIFNKIDKFEADH